MYTTSIRGIGRSPLVNDWRQLLWTCTIASGAALCAGVVESLPLRDSFLLTGSCIAVGAACNRRLQAPVVIITATFWELLRRLVPSSDPSHDLFTVTPYLVMLPAAMRGLSWVRFKPLAWLISLWTISIVYNPVVGLVGALDVIVPVLAGIELYNFSRASALRWLQAAVAFAAVYGIVQWVSVPSWDAAWVRATQFSSVGVPGTPQFRIMATYSSPGAAAVFFSAAILLLVIDSTLISVPRPVRTLLLCIDAAALVGTGVRSVWIAVVAGLLVAIVTRSGQRRSLRYVALLVVVVLVSPLASAVSRRILPDHSVASDPSLRARLSLLHGWTHYIFPWGHGLGTLSAASRIGVNGSVDNGLLVTAGESGLVAVIVLLALFCLSLRNGRPVTQIFAVVFMVLDLAGPIITGETALLVGLLWFGAMSTGEHLPRRRKNSPVGVERA